MLDYDNSAFYYFSITLLTFYLIPGGWYIFSEIYAAFFKAVGNDVLARTSLEKEKASYIKKTKGGINRLKTWQFILNLIIFIVAFCIFAYLVRMVIGDGEVYRFDPFQILGIDNGAELSEIKKAYRKLSLKYHPDKNIGDKVAEDMFVKIAKAYEALTDETSKANYEKFGNPDGKQALEVSIGLPKALLENPKVVLVLYLLGMVVVIPIAVYLWYANSTQYGEKNIMHQTYDTFFKLVNENTRTKMMPEILATAAEYMKLFHSHNGDSKGYQSLLAKLNGKVKGPNSIHKPKFDNPAIMQSNLLLHAHMQRDTADLSLVSVLWMIV
jgi:translocation protein SEC63